VYGFVVGLAHREQREKPDCWIAPNGKVYPKAWWAKREMDIFYQILSVVGIIDPAITCLRDRRSII
jgi:hypothetical protein